jgi:hypothetical protein
MLIQSVTGIAKFDDGKLLTAKKCVDVHVYMYTAAIFVTRSNIQPIVAV